mmetsp:Transcript_67444/g.201506  ORF Transcript_67444/g.201506 Transcript_67444/m.201506 type:complete len:190 (-) Transcript_67444:1232-1801(-)
MGGSAVPTGGPASGLMGGSETGVAGAGVAMFRGLSAAAVSRLVLPAWCASGLGVCRGGVAGSASGGGGERSAGPGNCCNGGKAVDPASDGDGAHPSFGEGTRPAAKAPADASRDGESLPSALPSAEPGRLGGPLPGRLPCVPGAFWPGACREKEPCRDGVLEFELRPPPLTDSVSDERKRDSRAMKAVP